MVSIFTFFLCKHFYFFAASILMILCRLYRCIITKIKSIPADTMEVIMKTGYAPNFIPAKTGKKLNTAIISCPTSDWHMICAISFQLWSLAFRKSFSRIHSPETSVCSNLLYCAKWN